MTTNESLTYTAGKDGAISIKDTEGKDIRYVKEADLLAVKGSSEASERRATDLARQVEESQASNKAEIATANTQYETAHNQVLQAEAKISSLEEQVARGTGSAEELATVKQALETAKTSGEGLTAKALEYRRMIIVSTYGIPADTVKEKTMEQLDNYEEALKSIIATKGLGNYAIGGGSGGPVPTDPIERAKAVIAQAMERRMQGFKQ